MLLRPGLPSQQMNNYTRNGTTSLFAALNTAICELIGKCCREHCSVELKKFLAIIDKAVLTELDLHLVLDNYSTHKTAMIHNWLLHRPRFHLHFRPTSAPWINQVQRWFEDIRRECIRCGTLPSTQVLETATKHYLQVYNDDPQPFVWTQTPIKS